MKKIAYALFFAMLLGTAGIKITNAFCEQKKSIDQHHFYNELMSVITKNNGDVSVFFRDIKNSSFVDSLELGDDMTNKLRFGTYHMFWKTSPRPNGYLFFLGPPPVSENHFVFVIDFQLPPKK